MRQPQKPFEYENLEDDFRISYNNAGSFDVEVLKNRYMNLTNAPKQLLQKRYTKDQW